MTKSERPISKVLFVCTGNTCRSPLAEAYARKNYPSLKFSSAGLAAQDGQPASKHSLVLARELGLDLSGHKSKCAAQFEDGDFDLVFGMTNSHARRLESLQKDWRVELLGGHSEISQDIADPYGGSESEYRQAFGEIQQAIDQWMKRLVPDMALTETSSSLQRCSTGED